jgi:uncharacterized protein (DUF1501 family)
MHTNEGRIDGGDMQNHMVELDAALGAFVADLGPALANVTIVTLTEFGPHRGGERRHRHRPRARVPDARHRRWDQGRQVYGRVAGLDDKSLFINGSLAARTDYRDVLGEVLTKRATSGSLTKVFPDHKPKPLGLANAR